MSSVNRRFNMAIVEAELAGKTHYFGKVCTINRAHISSDGKTLRDTVKTDALLVDERRTSGTKHGLFEVKDGDLQTAMGGGDAQNFEV